MLNFFKILFFIILITFWLNSCKEEKKVISTVSSLENIEITSDKLDKNNFCNQFIESWKYTSIRSETIPKINKTHIFCWEYNKRWKPTWFHAKILGLKPETIVSFKIKDKKNKYWVYTANIEIKNLNWGKNKTKFSSIFPDNLTVLEVEKAIINAFKNNYKYNKDSWYFKGPSWLWFDISWYTYKGDKKINTAFPIY